jgi:FtsP/CotA-like multicopper oxidase with cupredoxin domain
MEISRRHLLGVGAAVGVGLLLPPLRGGSVISARSPLAAAQASPALTKFTETLPIPGAIDLTGGGSASLALAPGSHTFHGQLGAAATFGYGGASYLGPTLLVKQGQSVSITFLNNLGAHPLAGSIDTTLDGAVAADKTTPRASAHVHGGLTQPQFDGHPEDTYLPGNSKTYTYLNGQEAATVWYHDHALGITRLNVYAGLAGYYLIRDQFDTGLASNPLGLPAPYGLFELPLVLQDKTFNANGTLFYDTQGVNPAVHPQWVPEFFGDVAVVNGKAFPNLNVAPGLYRFRIVNGSDARFYNLTMTPGKANIIQIGTDGGLLNAPVNVTQLLLGPGERADVLIDFSPFKNGDKIVLKNNARTPFPSGPRNKRKGGVPLPELMQFTVDTTLTPFQGTVPATLRGGPGQPPAITPPARPPAVRNLVLNEILDPATGFPLTVLLNNLHFNTANIETPKQGTTEMWNLINTTADTHPIHLHLVQFQLLERQPFKAAAYLAAFKPGLPNPGAEGQGPHPAPSADQFATGAAKPPDRNERGFKDTIRANPGEITRIVAKFPTQAQAGFDPDAKYTNAAGQTLQGYVWHCHILEHEDNDMMLKYRVIP